MADLLQPQLIAELITLFQAPFLDSFGATETGMAPASKGLIPIGHARPVSTRSRVRLPGAPGR